MEGFQPQSRIKSGRHDVPVIFYGFPNGFPFFSLHDFQTQSATLKLVERLARCDVRQRLKFWGDLESLDM